MSEVYLGMGSIGYTPDEQMLDMIESVLNEIRAVCRPVFGYKIVPISSVEQRSVTLGDKTLNTGSVITSYLEDADALALFIATSGVEFEKWLHQVKDSGDIMKEFIADAIGSEIAEATVRAMSDDLEQTQSLSGNKISNSYSPGYCGWHVREQKGLFSMLPPDPCGVTLSDSSLMTPIKSVSGIIAVGSKVKKMPYGCQICAMKTCYKKRAKALAASSVAV